MTIFNLHEHFDLKNFMSIIKIGFTSGLPHYKIYIINNEITCLSNHEQQSVGVFV